MASLTGVTLADNTAQGGDAGPGYWVYPDRGGKRYRVRPSGGFVAGGGLYARTAVVSVGSCTMSRNEATGGSGGGGGQSYGGGIYLGFGAAVDWDSATRFVRNRAGTGNDFYRA